MRRSGWIGSALLHLMLLVAFFLIRISVPLRPVEYTQIEFLSPPESEVAPSTETLVLPPESLQAPREPRGEETPVPAVTVPRRDVRSRVGVREGINWIADPPGPEPLPLDVAGRTRSTAGPVRRALATAPSYLPLDNLAATAVDTMLFAQERLAEIATEVMEEARKGPKGARDPQPFPIPGSITELRGEPQLPVMAVAGALISMLTELGKKAWDRLTKRDPDAVPEPDLDLTFPEVLAYAGLDEYQALSIFEWYSRLHPDFTGRLGDLQRLAAGLSDRGLIRMIVDERMIRYRRIVPLHELVEYYSSYLNRLPARQAAARREELIQILAALVRIPDH